MNAERFIKQKEITWDKPFSNWNRTAFKKALNEFAEMQKQAINYTHSCEKLKDKYTNEFWFWLERFESEDNSNRLWWYKKEVMLSTEEMWQEYNRLKTTL